MALHDGVDACVCVALKSDQSAKAFIKSGTHHVKSVWFGVLKFACGILYTTGTVLDARTD